MHLEFPAARPVATKCPPVNSRFSFSFGSSWLSLLFYKGLIKVIILNIIFVLISDYQGRLFTLTNLPSFVMAPTDSKHHSVIWFQIYYKWLLEFLCRSVIGRQLAFLYLNSIMLWSANSHLTIHWPPLTQSERVLLARFRQWNRNRSTVVLQLWKFLLIYSSTMFSSWLQIIKWHD